MPYAIHFLYNSYKFLRKTRKKEEEDREPGMIMCCRDFRAAQAGLSRKVRITI